MATAQLFCQVFPHPGTFGLLASSLHLCLGRRHSGEGKIGCRCSRKRTKGTLRSEMRRLGLSRHRKLTPLPCIQSGHPMCPMWVVLDGSRNIPPWRASTCLYEARPSADRGYHHRTYAENTRSWCTPPWTGASPKPESTPKRRSSDAKRGIGDASPAPSGPTHRAEAWPRDWTGCIGKEDGLGRADGERRRLRWSSMRIGWEVNGWAGLMPHGFHLPLSCFVQTLEHMAGINHNHGPFEERCPEGRGVALGGTIRSRCNKAPGNWGQGELGDRQHQRSAFSVKCASMAHCGLASTSGGDSPIRLKSTVLWCSTYSRYETSSVNSPNPALNLGRVGKIG